MISIPGRLVVLAALSCLALPVCASDSKLFADFSTCKKPRYPARAIQSGDDGVSLLGFLVRADGAVANTVVLNSSGAPDLDRAAAFALSKCLFRRAQDIDQAADLWVSVTYIWSLGDDPDMHRAMHAAAVAAGRGKVAARYHLSLLLFSKAKTDADREKALVVLRSAAELGHAHAQFDLARRHEIGEGVEADLDEALRWYRQSAEQGDPLAKQRLTLGRLLN